MPPLREQPLDHFIDATLGDSREVAFRVKRRGSDAAWRDSSNEERLDGENGLLLTPSIDHLFDRGFIGFEGSGALLISPVADRKSLERMGVQTGERLNVGAFAEGQRRYLDWHQEYVFLQSRLSADR